MSVAGTIAPSSPYKGLAAFDDTELDALLFFGRTRETEVVAANVLASRLTVLYGPSGVGKSSLLRAGVVRALRAEGGFAPPAVAVYGSWAGDPLAGLEEAARAAVAEALGREPSDAPGSLTDRLAAWSAELGAEVCLLLDQLEELFLYHPAAEGAGGFVDLLPDLVSRPGLRVNVLLGIRDDALAQLDVFKGRIPGLFANSLRLDHLDREAGRAAILGPLERYNTMSAVGAAAAIEPELVDSVLDEVAHGRIEPVLSGQGSVSNGGNAGGRVEAPYLQLVLQRIWDVERDRGSSALRVQTFRDLGGAQRIVEDHLERALQALTPSQQDAAASVFGHLVTPSGTKIAHGVSDLASYAAIGEGELEPVLASLAHERILRPLGENGQAGGRYEIFHDVLGGAILAWGARHDADAALVREREAARRRHRRLLLLLAGALIALALTAGLAAYAISQRSEAQDQAAAADAARVEAVELAALADKNAVRARASAKTAETEAENAREATADARRQTRVAESERDRADRASGEARAAKQKADLSAAEAEQSAAEAERSAAQANAAKEDALNQKDRAQTNAQLAQEKTTAANAAKRRETAAKKAALRSERAARGGRWVAEALAALVTDPERSLRFLLNAVGLVKESELEHPLRSALVAARVRHVLPAAGGVTAARFDGDGSRAVTADEKGEARVFRTHDGKLLGRFRAGSPLNDATLSPDGQAVAGAGRDGKVRVWRVDSGNLVQSLEQGGPVLSVDWSRDGRLLAGAGGGGSPSVRVWDSATWARLHSFDHRRPLRAVSFSPDGALLLTVALDRVVRVFEARTGAELPRLEHPGEVLSAEFAPQSDRIATGSRDRSARVWDVHSGSQTRTIPIPTGQVTDVAFDPTGERLATATTDQIARLWDARTGVLQDTLRGHEGNITDVDFSPNGAFVVTASDDGTARIWGSGALPAVLLGHDKNLAAASFAPNGRFALTASADGTARLWLPTPDPILRTIVRRGGAVTSVAFDPTGAQLASGGADGVVSVSASDGAPIWSLPLARPVQVVTWARNGSLLGAARNGLVRVWSKGGRQQLGELRPPGVLRAAALSPNGKVAATGGDDRVLRLWDVDSGDLLHAIPHPVRITAMAFSLDGKLLATGAGRTVFLWRAPSGAGVTQLLAHSDVVTALAFSPDGRQLVSGSADHDGVLWDVRRRKGIKRLSGHSAGLNGIAFSRDGRWVVTAGSAAAGVWQARASKLPRSFLFFLRGHERPLTSATFSPRDWRIATGSADGTIRTYSCALCGDARTLIRIANARVKHLSAQARTR